MAAILEYSLGELGRVGLLKVFRVEAERYPDKVGPILGTVLKTRQSYERMKSLVGLAPPEVVQEGDIIPTDNLAPLFVNNFYPFKVAMAVEFTHEILYVDQYRQIAELQPQIAKAFQLKRNQVAASLDNQGFTSTTMGITAETLYSTSHANNGWPGSNMPATALSFGPLAIAQMRSDMRQQVSARGQVMPYDGEIIVKYPYALDGRAYALAESEKMPTTNDNDKNYARVKNRYVLVDYYTSQTAWFARYDDSESQGLFLLEQMPYDIVKLPMDKRMMHTWIAWEKYVAGWRDWHGTYGTPGM